MSTTEDNGIHHWNDRGGIVGRGVLLDYVRYADTHGIEYHPMTRHAIGLEALRGMAQEEGVEFKPGDILIVRSGFTKWYEKATEEERKEKMAGDQWTGVEGSTDVVEWFVNITCTEYMLRCVLTSHSSI